MEYRVEMERYYLQVVEFKIEANSEEEAMKIAEDATYNNLKPDWEGDIELNEEIIVEVEDKNADDKSFLLGNSQPNSVVENGY